MWPCSAPAGDGEGTLEAYRWAINEAMAEVGSHPDDPEGWADVGWVRTHIGLDLWVRGARRDARDQLRLAAEDFRRALDSEPANTNIQNMAAWLHVFCPDPQIRDERLALEQSQRLVKQASMEGKDRPRFSRGVRPLFTLALAQYRTGDWQAARSTIEESISKKVRQAGRDHPGAACRDAGGHRRLRLVRVVDGIGPSGRVLDSRASNSRTPLNGCAGIATVTLSFTSCTTRRLRSWGCCPRLAIRS